MEPETLDEALSKIGGVLETPPDVHAAYDDTRLSRCRALLRSWPSASPQDIEAIQTRYTNRPQVPNDPWARMWLEEGLVMPVCWWQTGDWYHPSVQGCDYVLTRQGVKQRMTEDVLRSRFFCEELAAQNIPACNIPVEAPYALVYGALDDYDLAPRIRALELVLKSTAWQSMRRVRTQSFMRFSHLQDGPITTPKQACSQALRASLYLEAARGDSVRQVLYAHGTHPDARFVDMALRQQLPVQSLHTICQQVVAVPNADYLRDLLRRHFDPVESDHDTRRSPFSALRNWARLGAVLQSEVLQKQHNAKHGAALRRRLAACAVKKWTPKKHVEWMADPRPVERFDTIRLVRGVLRDIGDTAMTVLLWKLRYDALPSPQRRLGEGLPTELLLLVVGCWADQLIVSF